MILYSNYFLFDHQMAAAVSNVKCKLSAFCDIYFPKTKTKNDNDKNINA